MGFFTFVAPPPLALMRPVDGFYVTDAIGDLTILLSERQDVVVKDPVRIGVFSLPSGLA